MLLKNLKVQFIEQLKNSYPQTEIESFFYLLTEAFLGMKRIDVAINPQHNLTREKSALFEDAVSRLLAYEPVQYIIGNTEFYGYPFNVNKNVLIPRPETEELVEWIIKDLRMKIQDPSFSILDIGTGSGCIPISLAKEFPGAKVFSMDISEKALEIAQLNAKLNGVEVEFIQQDVLKLDTLPQKYQVIVSNPPYVRDLEKAEIHKNVLKHEPEIALYVNDEDPLVFYRKIAQLAKESLAENGALYFEINQYLPEEMKTLLNEEGFQEVALKKDIFDNYRMCKATL